MIEPHAMLLEYPPDRQMLFKIMSLEHFCQSLTGQYLYFNRVDCYKDDTSDGAQPPADRALSRPVTFEDSPQVTLENYYDRCRQRTYASCFTFHDSPDMWQRYGGPGGQETKVALCMTFGTLRRLMNAAVQRELDLYDPSVRPIPLKQVLSVNYGKVSYGDAHKDRLTGAHYPNPATFAFYKDRAFQAEQELRVTLSGLGVGLAMGSDGQPFVFPPSLLYCFDLKSALVAGDLTLKLDLSGAIPQLDEILRRHGIVLDT